MRAVILKWNLLSQQHKSKLMDIMQQVMQYCFPLRKTCERCPYKILSSQTEKVGISRYNDFAITKIQMKNIQINRFWICSVVEYGADFSKQVSGILLNDYCIEIYYVFP